MLAENFSQNRIARKLVISIVLFSSLITLVTTSSQIYLDYQTDVQRINSYLTQVESSYLPSLINSMWEYNNGQIGTQLDGILGLPGMEYIEIRSNGKIIRSVGIHKSKHTIEKEFPLIFHSKFKDNQLGVLRVVNSLDVVYDQLFDRAITILISNAIKTFLVSAFILILVHQLITKRLFNLAALIKEIGAGRQQEQIRLDQTVFWANKPDEFEEVAGAINSMQDQLKQSFKELSDSEERFRSLVYSASTVILYLTSEHRILEFNPEAEQLYGYKREEVLGKDYLELFIPKAIRTAVASNIKRALAGDPTRDFESIILARDGTEYPVLWNVSRVLDSNNQPVGVICVGQDITDRKKAEEENQVLEKRLQQAQKMESIGTLAGGIAHDFNNILAVILGYAEIIRDDCPADSKIIGDIDQVIKASNRAKELVKQILAFSRQSETEKIPMQPAVIIKDAIKLLRPSLPTTITIKKDIDPNAGVILADPNQIHQVLMNLCTNAFHAMEINGGTLSISLHGKVLAPEELGDNPNVQPGNFVQLSVRDSGVGIPPEIRKRIFDPYFTTKEIGKGTGMGLAMVLGIIESYGGYVTCESQLGVGTVFHVFIPLAESIVLPKIGSPETIPFGKEHILLIDDEEILLKMGKTLLERLGYRVTARKNSISALTTFQNQPDTYELVITDQTMPGMTGIDIARSILQIRPDMPIILCTGYSGLISEEKAKSMGIKGFAMKPITKKDIATLIRDVLEKKNDVG